MACRGRLRFAMSSRPKEAWSSKLGVIMAVAGSAVGLGNFLRFPGLVAHPETGGGAFLIAYFVSLLLVGLPVCWVEWTLGRAGGAQGFNSSPGIFHAILRKPWGKYLGLLGFVVPVGVYFYYVVIESWCLGYAWHSFAGNLDLSGKEAFAGFFADFTGQGEDGHLLAGGGAVAFFAAVFVLNFAIIHRGLSGGIELVCKWGMPLLILLALVLLVRVLALGTPDPAHPELSIWNGLGYMWDPKDVAAGLANPAVWLKAASQVFFTLSVGFGVIITYASYLRPKDDVVLSGLTSSAANEFCEVGLGGLITVPAAVAFLGVAGVAGQAGVGLGFKVLPLVFAKMPAGDFFGGAFFFMLFLAAVTSSISMLQPGIAFVEEALGVGRRVSVTLLGLLTCLGCGFVVYFSGDLKALDTLDFWVGTFLIFTKGFSGQGVGAIAQSLVGVGDELRGHVLELQGRHRLADRQVGLADRRRVDPFEPPLTRTTIVVLRSTPSSVPPHVPRRSARRVSAEAVAAGTNRAARARASSVARRIPATWHRDRPRATGEAEHRRTSSSDR